jgi:hypothetical protein
MKGRGTYFRNGIEVPQGKFYIDGEAIELSAESINKIAGWNTVTTLNGSAGQKACVTNGVTAITGGEGIADMTLAAPSPGDKATIRLDSITDTKTVVVTCATGVTLDGTNKKATFDAAGEALVLAYKSPTQWQIVLNIGGVALSA